MFWRFGFCVLLLVVALDASAQRDSLLQQITVYGSYESDYLTGSRVTKLDTLLFTEQNSRHLGEILSFQFPIYFRNYGSGMISGISMRGTAPQHVAVRWNGVNITSFSLGQSDFSLLPAVAFDEVEVHEGGGSARFGSGAFGGSILLTAKVKSPRLLSISQEFGSFGRYFASGKASVSMGKLTSSTSFYHLQAANDFPVASLGHRQQNAAYRQDGIIQGFEYSICSNKQLTANYWYHEADREIQPTAGNNASRDEQQDRSHRLSVAYEQRGTGGKSRVAAALVNDVIVYNKIRSEIFRLIASANHHFYISDLWNISGGGEWNHIVGRVPEYGPDGRTEDRFDLNASVLRRFARITVTANLRKPFISRVATPLLPYVGAEITALQKGNNVLKLVANSSYNFRAPTFNDRYWLDAGKKDLLPETSFAAEGGATWENAGRSSVGLTAFYQHVDEWIQWIPGNDGEFRPQNLKTVVAKGLEASANSRIPVGKWTLFATAAYQLTSSVTVSSHDLNATVIGKQLIYTPRHTAAATFGAKFNTWSGLFSFQYSGERFTEASNADTYRLAPFALVDFSISKSWLAAIGGRRSTDTIQRPRNRFDFSFTVKNIFDADYQLYSGRAMPGRNFNVKLSYQLNRKNS
jgi:iron complex outermembrane receptor protein